jgi:hypothetical protein
MRLTFEQRSLIADARRRNIKISRIAEVFDTSETTVKRWSKRKTFKDKPRNPKESKITLEVELTILGLRNTFGWGCERIQKGLINLPPYMREVLPTCIQNVKLSRQAINDVLKKHKLNGYKKKVKSWKFFRAKRPNELWQLDIKGPFRVEGKKHYFVICIDDYSRYLLLAKQLEHDPKVEEMKNMLLPLIKKYKPKNILTDNKPFREEWDNWCKGQGIEPLHAHPYYPQDKGKVERAIRNISEEFIYLIKKFREWIDGKIKNYKQWFNHRRFHRGINDYPAALFLGR